MPVTSTAALAPLRHDLFRAVWLASISSNFGLLLHSVAMAWMMTAIAESDRMVALVPAAAALPVMLFSIPCGAVADIFERHKVMMVAQCCMASVAVAFTAVAVAGAMTPWLLLAFAFLIGCGNALNNPAWEAAIVDLVPRPELPSAVALGGVSMSLVRSAGPALSGALMAWAGAAAAFGLFAATFLPQILVLSRWSLPPREAPAVPTRLWPSVAAGLRAVASSSAIGKVMLRSVAFGFATVAVPALLPLLTRDVIGGGALLYGVLIGCFGTGALAGAVASGVLRRRLSSEWCVRLAFLTCTLGTGAVAVSNVPLVTGLMLAACGAGWIVAVAIFQATVQMAAPAQVGARTIAIYHTATFAGMTAGGWTWGVVTESAGVTGALLVAAAVMLGGAALGIGPLAMPDHAHAAA